ncbi:type II toxin-antitoxin system RelE/ParE family toxin [soil metagenome]
MKPIKWISSSYKDLLDFPKQAMREVGHALFVVQQGQMAKNSKPLLGFGGASVLELVEDWDGNTYRAVYTVRFDDAVYVLHCFQKKSRSRASTPKYEIELVKRRLRMAEEEHRKSRERES